MTNASRLSGRPPIKPIRWVGAKREVKSLPKPVQREAGFALYRAQLGDKHPDAKPLSGFGGASVLEIVEDHDRETYRVVYTVRFEPVVYVLHAFHKKSRKGIETPDATIELIRTRLVAARMHFETPPADLQWEIAEYRFVMATFQPYPGSASRMRNN